MTTGRLTARPWTVLDPEVLRLIYSDANNATLARVLGKTKESVQRVASQLGLRKTDACLRMHCYPMKFKPGHAGYSTRPIGSVKQNKKWELTKVASVPGRYRRSWRRTKIVEFERAHGPIPRGFVLTQTGELISQSEQMRLNCFPHYSQELWQVMQALNILKQAIRVRADEEQAA